MEKEKTIPVRDLEWKRSPDFHEKVSDVMSLMTSERFFYLDFGSFDYEGREAGTFAPIKPYINYHTRIIVSYEHFKEIVKVLNEVLKAEKERRGERE
jgi:hypothetical protein